MPAWISERLTARVLRQQTSGIENVPTLELRHGDGHAEEARETRGTVVRSMVAERARHPFYKRLSEVLDQAGFDGFRETGCAQFYHEKLGRR